VLRARQSLGMSFEAFPALRSWLTRLEERPAVAREVELVAAS
jgi:glutathione S-transferase